MELQITTFLIGYLVCCSYINSAYSGTPITDFQKQLYETLKTYWSVTDNFYKTDEGKQQRFDGFKASTTYWCEDDAARSTGTMLTDFQDIYVRNLVRLQTKYEGIRDVRKQPALFTKWEKTMRIYCEEEKKTTLEDRNELEDNSLEKPLPVGTPLTNIQLVEYRRTLRDQRELDVNYRIEGGEDKMLKDFTDMATQYCEDSKRLLPWQFSDFQLNNIEEYLDIYRQFTKKFEGDDGAREFACRWNLRRLEYCAEREKDSGFQEGLFESLGTPVTYYQRTVFQNELRIHRMANNEYLGEIGETEFLMQFIKKNDNYCLELWQPQLKSSEFKTKMTAEALEVFRKYNPSLYNGDQGEQLFLAKWNNVRRKFCKEAFRRVELVKKKEKEEQMFIEAAERNETLPEPPRKPETRRIVVFTAHYLLRVQESVKSPREYQDHTDVIVMARRLTVEEIADKVKELRESKVEELKNKGFKVFNDPWKLVEQLYIEGKDEPILNRGKINSGADAQMYTWVKDAAPHYHIYTYDPKKSTFQIKRSTERKIYFIFHARINCYYFFGAKALKYDDLENTSMEDLAENIIDPIVEEHGFIEPNNIFNNGLILYLSNGNALYTKKEEGDTYSSPGYLDEDEGNWIEGPDPSEDPDAILKDRLANSKLKDQDPLLIYNTHPRMRQPWMM